MTIFILQSFFKVFFSSEPKQNISKISRTDGLFMLMFGQNNVFKYPKIQKMPH